MTKAVRHRLIVDQITTKTDKRFEPVAHMADAIVETTLALGDCSQQDLIAKGFTHQDIASLWHFANALAALEINRRTTDTGYPHERGARYA